MRKARATAAASKPKPRAAARPKPKPKPKAKPSPASLLSGGSSSLPPAPASVSTVAELRGLAASHLDSSSAGSTRSTMQTQSCLQLADEAEKEHRKMAGKISEHAEAVKASYKKFVAEVCASTSRVCKVTIPEMAKSADRAIDGLRSRYNIPATAV
uniref:Uncharacterized protein n=1 Tax=Oryza brachyantha TaxID=4533 RepID=J3MQW8_ORYBR